MIERDLRPELERLAALYPVVTLTGPRQAGKTTICKAAFPELPYANLEHTSTRAYATEDPEGFLASYPDGAVIDEVQRVPDLLSLVQVRVDDTGRGLFVLTGSQQPHLTEQVTQTLAGRTALTTLLPFSAPELRRGGWLAGDPFQAALVGGYPRIHERGLPAGEWLDDYTATYLERDVRQVSSVGDLELFRVFLGLVAGRSAQLVGLSSLGNDTGVSHTTARRWLSVLEAGFVVHRVLPWHRNLGKRLTKTPKCYFLDSGLMCSVLGIRTRDQLVNHPLRGAVFETWAVSEISKAFVNRRARPRLHFHREHRGNEVDLVIENAGTLTCVEIKSAQTASASFLKNLRRLRTLVDAAEPSTRVRLVAVYAGHERQDRSDATILPWSQIGEFDWAGEDV